MQNREENYEYEYDDVLFFYVAGVLKEKENLELCKVVNRTNVNKQKVEEYEKILISLAENYVRIHSENLKYRILSSLTLF